MMQIGEARSWQIEPWRVDVHRTGAVVSVQPVSGLIAVESPRWPACPRTKRGFERAIRRCQRFCDRENRRIERAKALVP